MKTKKLSESSWLHYDASGALRSDPLPQGLLLHTCRGVLGRDFAYVVIEDGKRCLERFGRCVIMVDGVEVTRMSTDFRETVTGWLVTAKQTEIHFLLQSKMVEMAINVANLVALRKSPVKAYTKVADWEAVGRQSVPAFRRTPLVDPVHDNPTS